jgi:tetratricopeptide (TPR) repeat protein
VRLLPLLLLAFLGSQEPPSPSLVPRPQLAGFGAQDDAFRQRLAQRKADAAKRVAEAKRAIAAEDARERAAADALRARLADKTVALSLRAGDTYPKAVVRRWTIFELETDATTIAWSALKPESVLAAADLLFRADNAPEQFMRGRLLVHQRLWKEARQAFERAASLDKTLEARAARATTAIARVLRGMGMFNGDAKRPTPTSLHLTYDWKEAAQSADFADMLSVDGGSATLDDEADDYAYVSDVPFTELDVELKLKARGSFSFDVLTDYTLTIDMDGLTLARIDDKGESDEIATSDKAKLNAKKFQSFRLALKDRKLTLSVDGKEALAHALPSAPRGSFGFGMDEGSGTVGAPLVVRGSADRRVLDKKFAEADVHAQRAADPDIEDIEARRDAETTTKIGTLTSDDAHLLKDAPDLAKVKEAVAAVLDDTGDAREALKTINDLIAKHAGVATLLVLRALVHFHRDDIASAQADVSAALAAFPECAEAHVLQARIHDWDQDWDRAVAAAQRAIDAFPDTAAAYVVRALASYGRDPSSAPRGVDDARLAVALDPTNREAATTLRGIRLQSRGPRELGARFEHESAHYRVVTDISADAAKAYSDKLEAAFRKYADTFKHAYVEKPFPKPRVVVFNVAESFHTYSELVDEEREEENLGHFTDRWNELVLFETPDADETNDTLYHEAFHHFTILMARQTLPYWYNEGIAEYMAGVVASDGGPARMQKYRLPDIQRAIEAGFAVPWDRIMVETPTEFYDDPENFKYAQAWSMVFFLYEHEKGRHRPLIEKYFDALRARKTAREAFDAVFKDSWRELEKEWIAFVKALRP